MEGLAESAVDVHMHVQAVASVLFTFQGYKAHVKRKAERILYLFICVFILKYICICFVGFYMSASVSKHILHTMHNFCMYHTFNPGEKTCPSRARLSSS